MNQLTPYNFILLILLFSGLLFLLYRRENNLWSPPFIFTLFWGSILLFSILSGGGYYFSFSPLLFIFSLISCFSLGWLVSPSFYPFNKSIQFSEPPVNLLKQVTVISIMAGLLSIFLLIKETLGVNFSSINKNTLSALSATLSMERYEGKRLSPFIMLAMSFNYIGCFTGGTFLFLSKKKTDRIIAGVVLIPLLVFSVIYTSRSVFLYGLFMFVASWLLMKSASINHTNNKIPIKWIITVIIGVAGIFGLFMISQGLRMGINHLSFETFDRLFSYLRVWFAGNVSSFCMWYDQPDAKPLYTHGSYTLAGLSEVAGFGQRVPGIYTVSYDVSGKLEVTNIYTLFRFIIDDFGWIGAVLFFLITGIISRYLYDAFLSGSYIAIAILSGIFAGLLFSFIASIWAYNSILMAWFSFIFICSIPTIKKLYFG